MSRIIPRPAGPRGNSSRPSPRDRAEVPPLGSRRDLRRGLHPARRPDGDPAGDGRPQSTLAEPFRGAGDRLHPPRVPGSLYDSKRDPSSAAPASLRRLLQRGAATPIVRDNSPEPQHMTAAWHPLFQRRPDPGRSPGPRSAAGVTHHPPVVACLGFAGGRPWQPGIAAEMPTADDPHPASEDRTGLADQVFDHDRRQSPSHDQPQLHRLRLCPSLCDGHCQLALEHLALRQPLTVYQTAARLPLRRRDRLVWAWLSTVWTRIVREAPHHLNANDQIGSGDLEANVGLKNQRATVCVPYPIGLPGCGGPQWMVGEPLPFRVVLTLPPVRRRGRRRHAAGPPKATQNPS